MHHIPLDQRADLAADLPKRGGCALTCRLMDVIQHQTVDGAILCQKEQRAFTADLLMAVDIANGHIAANRAFVKTNKRTAIGTVSQKRKQSSPSGVALLQA